MHFSGKVRMKEIRRRKTMCELRINLDSKRWKDPRIG